MLVPSAGKNVTAISERSDFPAKNIVDGVTDGSISYFVTNNVHINPWVRIDLLKVVHVSRIVVYNRNGFYSKFELLHLSLGTQKS